MRKSLCLQQKCQNINESVEMGDSTKIKAVFFFQNYTNFSSLGSLLEKIKVVNSAVKITFEQIKVAIKVNRATHHKRYCIFEIVAQTYIKVSFPINMDLKNFFLSRISLLDTVCFVLLPAWNTAKGNIPHRYQPFVKIVVYITVCNNKPNQNFTEVQLRYSQIFLGLSTLPFFYLKYCCRFHVSLQ